MRKVRNYLKGYEILEFHQLNDSISFAVIEELLNVGSNTYLISFNNQNEIDYALIAMHLDYDLGVTNVASMEYSKVQFNSYQVLEEYRSINEKYLDENHNLPEGKSIDDFEVEIETESYLLEVDQSGNIVNRG